MFNKEKVKILRIEITEALKEVERAHGVKFNLGVISFGETDFRTQLTCIMPGVNGDNIYEIEWHKFHSNYGLVKNDLGREFIPAPGADTFKIVGIKRSNRKYPIIARNTRTNKLHKFTVFAVTNGFM
ncbi:MAG: hypothetical protein M0P14_00790 [Alkaliphilus sp.]|nr:hypothetical protein [Alkaliphilus sp.]